MSGEISTGMSAGSLDLADGLQDSSQVADRSKNDLNSVRDRLRNDGLQTVSKLLQESRAENKILKEKNNQLQRAVDTLNCKLQKSGSGGTGPTSNGDSRATSNPHEDEFSLPASSKHLVENLIRENNRLKHQLHNPQKVDEISMRACNLQSLNNSLKQEKGKLEQELRELKSAIQLADGEKDKLIVRLGEQLKDFNQNFQRERSHRLTLEAEINKLNDELTDTAQKCLNMRKQLPSGTLPQAGDKLDSLTAAPDSLGALSGTQGLSEHSVYDQNARLEARCAQLEQQVQSLQKLTSSSRATEQLIAENSRLKARLADREGEIDKLKEQCAVLKHQLEIYHEDFKKERTDREITHRRFAKMEEEYRNLAMKVPASSSTANNAWDGRQQAASRPRTAAVRLGSQSSSKPVTKDNQRKTANKPTDKSTNRTLASASLSLDVDNDSLSSQTELVRPSLSNKQKPDLACYKCDKRFGVDRHSELIDHLDVCPGPK